jgi:hypothetical protein
LNPFSKKRKFDEVANTPGKGDLNKSANTTYYDAQSNNGNGAADVSYEDYQTAKDESRMEIDTSSAPLQI